MQLSTMQRLAVQMFVQDSSKSAKKSKPSTPFMVEPSNEWERFNELCMKLFNDITEILLFV